MATKAWMLMVGLMLPMAGMAADGWHRLHIGEQAYSVDLPGKAKAKHESQNWGMFGTTESDSVMVKAHGGEMVATVTQAPTTAIRLAGNGLIQTTTRSTILKSRAGSMTSWTPVTRGGIEGRRLTYEATVDGVPMRGVMEVFVQSPHILTLDAFVPADAPADAAERFFASLVTSK